MTLFTHKQIPALLLAGLVLLGGVACQRRCQAADTTVYKSMVDAQWRLVETNDPDALKTLSNYTFLIMTFARNNTGDVKNVVDNDQYDTPVYSIVWAPDATQKLVRIQYSKITGTGNQTQAANPGDGGTYDYMYTLSNQLTLTETSNPGYYYRYVPFKGVVNPDTECSF
jgi:hypothetical protein